MTVYIHRERTALKKLERYTLVEQVSPASRVWIDPQERIQLLTGVHFNRHACVVSMAEGFKNAGHQVFMSKDLYPNELRPVPHVFLPFQSPTEVFHIYWLVGFLYGRGGEKCFLDFKRKLESAVMPLFRRVTVEATAQRFFNNPLRPTESLYLVIP